MCSPRSPDVPRSSSLPPSWGHRQGQAAGSHAGSTRPSVAGVSWQGCSPVSSLIALGHSLLNGETCIIRVIKHVFEFSPESAVIIIIKRTALWRAFILVAQSSQ